MGCLLYSTGTKIDYLAMIKLCGVTHFTNTHHEDRNTNPYNLDKEGILLSPFQGPNYRSHLDEIFQQGTPASAPNLMTDAVTEGKPERMQTELMFWENFSSFAANLNRTAVFDIGVCASASLPDESNPNWYPHKFSLLDYLCLHIEHRKTYKLHMANDMGSVNPSMKSWQDTFYGPGKPSPFLMHHCVLDCGRAVVAGCKGYVSRCQRLVLKDNIYGWLSDVHSSYDMRRIILCDHPLMILGNFVNGEAKTRLSEYIMEREQVTGAIGKHVIYHMNQVCRILRGVSCPKRIGIHQPQIHGSVPFTESRSRWIALRELIAARNRGCFPRFKQIELKADEILGKLSCGIDIMLCLHLASWKDDSAVGVDVDTLETKILEKAFEVEDFVRDARNLETLELLAWIDMMIKFRDLSRSDNHGGMFAVDVADLYINMRFDAAADSFCRISGDNDIDDALDRIILAATGVSSMEQLEPLSLRQNYRTGDKLAAVIGTLKKKTVCTSGDRIRPGLSWMLDEKVPEEIDLLHKKKNARLNVKLLKSGDVISYAPGRARAVLRAVARVFRGVSVFGHGVSVDLTPILSAGAANSTNTLNELIGGEFGVEGVRFGLRLMFAGLVRVKAGHGTPTSYVPLVARHDDGVVMHRFLPADVMSQATYFERDGKIYWLPQEGMNIFEVTAQPKSGTTRFKEISEDVLVTEEVGLFDLKYKIGG